MQGLHRTGEAHHSRALHLGCLSETRLHARTSMNATSRTRLASTRMPSPGRAVNQGPLNALRRWAAAAAGLCAMARHNLFVIDVHNRRVMIAAWPGGRSTTSGHPRVVGPSGSSSMDCPPWRGRKSTRPSRWWRRRDTGCGCRSRGVSARARRSCASITRRDRSGSSICFQAGRRALLLHAFLKRTEQTPQRDLELARERLPKEGERKKGESKKVGRKNGEGKIQ